MYTHVLDGNRLAHEKKRSQPCVCYSLNFQESVCLRVYQQQTPRPYRPTQAKRGIKEFLHPILSDRLFYLYRKERKEKRLTEYQFLDRT